MVLIAGFWYNTLSLKRFHMNLLYSIFQLQADPLLTDSLKKAKMAKVEELTNKTNDLDPEPSLSYAAVGLDFWGSGQMAASP